MRSKFDTWPVPIILAIGLVLTMSLVATADNLLTNAGFEDGVSPYVGSGSGGGYGWSYTMLEGGNLVEPETLFSSLGYLGLPEFHDGSQAVRCYTYGYGHIMVYQDVPAMPGTGYTASAWVRTRDLGGGFGSDPYDSAGIIVEEYDEWESLVNTWSAGITTANSSYEQVSIPLTTGETTAKVRFILDTVIACAWSQGNVTYDDCSLDGPPVTCTISGTVSSGGLALAGATVQCNGASVTADADGAYTMYDVPLAPQSTDVTASKTGYFTQKKHRELSPGALCVDFDLTAAGNNILQNPGFDENWTTPWVLSSSADVVQESGQASLGGTSYCLSGEEAAAVMSPAGNTGGSVSQMVTVVPGTEYSAAAWVCVIGSSWGLDPNQKAGLTVDEYDKFGTLVYSQPTVWLSDFGSDWHRLALTFTASPSAAFVKVGGCASLTDSYNDTQARAVYDSFELNGTAGPACPQLYGRVISEGTPVAGATVMTKDGVYKTTSASDGYFALDMPDGTYSLKVIADDYYTQVLTVSVTPLTNLVVELQPVNLLCNAGFDEGWPYGWETKAETNGYVRAGDNAAQYGFPVFFQTGQQSTEVLSVSSAGGGGYIYQDVPTQPNADYTAFCWFYPYGPSWGVSSDQKAALFVEEYDGSGGLVAARPFVYASSFSGWTRLTDSFTTSSTTTHVRVGGYAHLVDDYNNTTYRAVFDTFSLSGPSCVYGFEGVVSCGSTPIQGATVTVTDQSVTPNTTTSVITGADGSYHVEPAKWHTYEVRVTKDGYCPQLRTRVLVGGMVQLDFDLTPVGTNILLNPGFDDGWPNGWSTETEANGLVRNGSIVTNWGDYPVFFHTGEESTEILSVSRAGGGGYIYQDVSVQSDADYTVSCWFYPYGPSWGVSPDQKAALFVEEYDSSGGLVTARPLVYATSFTGWTQLTDSFASSSTTAYVRVGGYAHLVDDYNNTTHRAVFDSFELGGPAGVSMSISDVKGLAEDESVLVFNRTVSASFDGYFYIQESDRSSGIKIIGTAEAGSIVNVFGSVSTVDGEKTITSTVVNTVGTGSVPAPLGMANRSTGSGLSAVGLYVTVWGRVQGSGGTFAISDGSEESLKVYAPAEFDAVDGDYLQLTGALGAEMSGGQVIPVLRVVSAKVVAE